VFIGAPYPKMVRESAETHSLPATDKNDQRNFPCNVQFKRSLRKRIRTMKNDLLRRAAHRIQEFVMGLQVVHL
jgi:CRISPR/Cas system type I-B associated protein Csh2 (Cas7 group RAMP superfamily)